MLEEQELFEEAGRHLRRKDRLLLRNGISTGTTSTNMSNLVLLIRPSYC